MSSKTPVVLSWSGGKDSSMAAYELLASPEFEVVGLLTTMTDGVDRISMHGVRKTLLEEQARCLGIPLVQVVIPEACTNEVYLAVMQDALRQFKQRGIERVAFGDLYLEDVRKYRDSLLAQTGMTGLYPLWKRDTTELIHAFIALGFKAILSCVDTQALDGAFAGREIDRSLLNDLPSSVDPCGENGEYHSFVYDGPIFKAPVACTTGERVLKLERFNYCEIVAS
jgi:uncharacterized protein (TIGR00290 family)